MSGAYWNQGQTLAFYIIIKLLQLQQQLLSNPNKQKTKILCHSSSVDKAIMNHDNNDQYTKQNKNGQLNIKTSKPIVFCDSSANIAQIGSLIFLRSFQLSSLYLRLTIIRSGQIIIENMRKRINSQEKYNYADVKAVALTLNTNTPSSKQLGVKHPPRPSKKSQSSKYSLSYLSKALCTQKIRQFPNPLLKELRRLVLNQIDSGDRLFRSLITEQHKAALQLYSQDRLKLIEYLNSLAIRQVNIDNIKLNLEKKKGKEIKNVPLEIPTLDLSDEVNETTRKRSKSEYPRDSQKDDELKMLKKKLRKIEKDCKQIINLKALSKNKQQKTREQGGNFLVQIKEILQDAMKNNTLKQNFVIFQKSEIQTIIYLLSQVMNHNQQQNILSSKQIEDMQIQIQDKQQLIVQLSRHLQQKITQIHLLETQCKENHTIHYEQLKEKVNYLYNQLSSLVNDAQTKDQLIQYLKSENQSLKNEIEGLEQVNNKAKKQQLLLTQYFQSLQERLRYSEDEVNRRQEQSNELRVELLHKDHELATKLKELRHLVANIQNLKQQSQQKIDELQKKLVNIGDQKHLVELQKEFLKSYVVKLEHKLKILEQLIRTYPKAAQLAQSSEIALYHKKDNIQVKIQENTVKNEVFKKVKQQTHNIINQAEEVLEIHQEKQQAAAPLIHKSLSLEVNESNFPANDDRIDFIGINLETPVKTRSLSLRQQDIFVTQRWLKNQDFESHQAANKPKGKKKIETLTELEDVYQSDDEGELSSYQRDSKDTPKVSQLSNQLKDHPKSQDKEQKQVQRIIQSKPIVETKETTLKELLEIEELDENQALKSSTENIQPHSMKIPASKVSEERAKVHSMQDIDEPKKTSIILNQQNQEQNNCKVSEVPSKMSQSSSRTIFIKWPAKKLMNIAESTQKMKNYGQ